MWFRRADADYLRSKARRFRRMATENDMPICASLLQIANELDGKADQIEQRRTHTCTTKRRSRFIW